MEEIQKDLDRVIELLNRVEDNCNDVINIIDKEMKTNADITSM